MSQTYRLPAGGLIDRDRPLSFRFDGKSYQGFAGDTLASALVANGVRLLGRSFKYHRPRGLVTAGPEEPNALVELRTGARREPNTKAPTVELYDGLEAASQNRFPSLGFDLLAVNSLFSPLFVGGFYYKTFMWPAPLWERLYEPLIRRAAGMGRASGQPDPDTYEKAHAFCDLLVIGSGPAGLAAALAGARSGARVILAEDDFALGGRLLSDMHEIDGAPALDWVRAAEAELAASPEVTVMRRSQVFGVYDGGVYGALERVGDHLAEPAAHQPRQRLWRIVARRAVLAAGAVERQLVFGGNDRPGVMSAAAVRTYLNRFGAAPGRRCALFTTTDDGWSTAAALLKAGVQLEAVIDPRPQVTAEVRARAGRARVILGGRVADAYGGKSLKRIEILRIAGERLSVEADLLAVSGGWSPQTALTSHHGAKPVWREDLAAFVPGATPPGLAVAGAAGGVMSLGDCLREGRAIAEAAVEALGFRRAAAPDLRVSDEPVAASPLWRIEGVRTKAFVDQQHDVTAADIGIAAREGFTSAELTKRYTTLGMATDQGRSSSLNGQALLAEATGRSLAETGVTLARPPYLPVAIGALAGHSRGPEFKPARQVAGADWAAGQGAAFVDAGYWRRPQWFAQGGEHDWLETVVREVEAVRTKVGVCDVSTLGKIDIQGTDSAAFLDRVCINTFSTLPVGKARYGLMLREDGLVLDDGTTARLAPQRWLMSTTTANAARVMQHLEYCAQVLWPELDVQLASVTEQWSQYAVAGPRSRELLQRLFGRGADLSNAGLPYMGAVELPLAGVPSRLFRLSFSGELAYELAVPAGYGDAALRALMAAGAPLAVTPYGVEALSVLRVEKGHVAGNELNGMTTAADLGLGRMMSAKKDYIGRVMAARPGLTDPDRPALVGLKPVDSTARLRGGAHFLPLGAAAAMENDQGYMTSVAYSPTCGHWIGLGLLARGPQRIGDRVRAWDGLRGEDIEVEVCHPVFVDPEGERLRA
jgi:sarcosine oxidase subunit alpha